METDSSPDGPVFGAGSGEPYEHAMRGTAASLHLHEVDPGGARSPSAGRPLDLARFLADADEVDEAVLRRARGSVLDVGCGPGRIVRAAATTGAHALGIDVSEAAVGLARRRGTRVLRRSVFDEVPMGGRWGTVVLLDGNIGIGGDPLALLRRCRALVSPAGGRVMVETHADPHADRTFTGVVEDDRGRRSGPFPWAELGSVGLRRYAARADLVLRHEWTARCRSFAEYHRP